MIYSSIIKKTSDNQVIIPKDLSDWYNENKQGQMNIMWNEQHRIVHFSQQLSNYTSIQSDQLLGQKWTIFFKENEVKKIQQHFANSNEKYSLANVILTNNNKEETRYQATIHQVPIDHQLIYICELDNGMYERILKKKVLDSEKLVLAAQLSAGLVHEIRNPLTSLKGFLQLVQSGVQQKNEYYQVMIGEVEKLEKITFELLQMAKPFKQYKKTEKLHILLEEVEFIMHNQSRMKNLTLEIHCDKDLSIYCNASQIKQVLINLILNGAEAMDNKGTIIVHAYELYGYITIDIIDEGEGISADVIREIQQPFFTTKKQGTGLGLIITQHLLELHQAELKITSNQIQGSTFTILLPMSREE